MGIKNIFALKKATRYSLRFVQPSLDAGNSLKWLLGIFQDGGPLTHSQVLSTFQDGGRVKFPTLGTVVDVKIPTHVRFTKSNSRGLPGPPILGQTIDRCITLTFFTKAAHLSLVINTECLKIQIKKSCVKQTSVREPEVERPCQRMRRCEVHTAWWHSCLVAQLPYAIIFRNDVNVWERGASVIKVTRYLADDWLFNIHNGVQFGL